jgi:hypothetical protein
MVLLEEELVQADTELLFLEELKLQWKLELFLLQLETVDLGP